MVPRVSGHTNVSGEWLGQGIPPRFDSNLRRSPFLLIPRCWVVEPTARFGASSSTNPLVTGSKGQIGVRPITWRGSER